MKNVLLLALLLLVLAGPAAAVGPQLVADQPDFQFGQVFQGDRVEHTFHFRNVGDAPLNIARVRSSCGCTAALLSAQTIAPGAAGEVKAVFDSARFRDAVTKTIYLYSDDPRQPEMQFTLSGVVREILAANPAQITLERPGERVERRVLLTNQGERDLEIATIKTSLPELRAEVDRKHLPPGESVQLVIKVKPKDATDRVSGYVFVRMVDEQVPELRIPVHAPPAR
jgi:hypothetical protein